MALVRGCTRCGTGYPTVTRVRAHPHPSGGLVEVRLCTDCRNLAAAENTAARARSTGSDPVPGPS